MDKKLYMVETISIFRHRYVVNAHEASHAQDEVVMNVGGNYDEKWQEFSQKHIDEVISSVRQISAVEYITEFDAENDFLKDWSIHQKMKFINEIDYEDSNNGQ
jgi:hypothetical protein